MSREISPHREINGPQAKRHDDDRQRRVRQKNEEIKDPYHSLPLVARHSHRRQVIRQIGNQEQERSSKRRNHELFMDGGFFVADGPPAQKKQNACRKIQAGIQGWQMQSKHILKCNIKNDQSE